MIIGGNDWAAAWAVDANGRPLTEPVPGGEDQREMALRFGINLVMYALTGNYKTDQVHAPALLERLGNDGTHMTRLAFAPHIPLPLLAALALIALADHGLCLCHAARAAPGRAGWPSPFCCSRWPVRMLVQETHAPLPDVVALVIDRSQSMEHRQPRTRRPRSALAQIRQALAAQPNLTVRETSVTTTTTRRE